jgi:hypothetical protein
VWYTSNKILEAPVLLPTLGSNNSLNAKMQAGASSEVSVLTCWTSRHFILEDTVLIKYLTLSKWY